MNRISAALAFGYAIIWATAANAGCMSEVQCDSAGTCTQVETCDGALDMDMAQTSPDAMTPIPAEADPPRRDARCGDRHRRRLPASRYLRHHDDGLRLTNLLGPPLH